MEEYKALEMEVILFESEDIIMTSNGDDIDTHTTTPEIGGNP